MQKRRKNYNFEKYKDVVNDTNDKKNKKNINIERQKNILAIKNPLLKKRKRRKKEDLTNGKEGNVTSKKTRGRFKKTDLKALNYIPDVENYKDIRHSKYGEKFTELFCDVLRNYKAVISKRFFRKNKTNVDSMDNINFEFNDNSFGNLLMENIYEKDF